MLSLLAATLLGQLAAGEQPAAYLWRTPEALGRGADRTFIAEGTHRGGRYRFKATGVCKWEPVPITIINSRGPIRPIPQSYKSIFGIDFKVQFGSDERQVLDVGTHVPAQNAIEFVADREDMPIRIFDNWDLPKGVTCTIDGIEVVSASLH